MKDLFILGAGGHAKEVAFLIEDINRSARSSSLWSVVGFIDKNLETQGERNGKYRILGDEDWLLSRGEEAHFALGVGTPYLARKIIETLQRHGKLRFPNLIHPDTIMDDKYLSLARGNVICAGNVFTTDIQIGSFNTFNRSSTYGHDMVVGDCNVINPGVNVSGGVHIGDGCLIGTGATILQGRRIDDGATVGAGAVVTKDVAAGQTVVGVPAAPLQRS